MAFNRISRSDIASTVSEEDYLEMLMRQRAADANAFQAAQTRQRGLVGSATRQVGDSLEKSTRNFVDSFGKGQSGASNMFGLQQKKRDNFRDEAMFDKDFRDADDPRYHREDMAPAARKHMEKTGYGFRSPPNQEQNQTFQEENIGSDMSTLEGRGQYFQNMESRPDYMKQSLPDQPYTNVNPQDVQSREVDQNQPAPSGAETAQPLPDRSMQPKGFPLTGPDTGYTIPDRSYSPGAADVLDGRATPGVNPGHTVPGPYGTQPTPQLPPLSEEEMEEDIRKKKDAFPVDSRWGRGLGREYSPEERIAAEESWMKHAILESDVGQFADLKKQEGRRYAQRQSPAHGMGFNLLQASSYVKDLKAEEDLYGAQINNDDKILSREDRQEDRQWKREDRDFKREDRQWQQEDRQEDRQWKREDRDFKREDRQWQQEDRDFKREDRQWQQEDRDLKRETQREDRDFKREERDFNREKWKAEQERNKAEQAGLKFSGQLTEDGYMIYNDKQGREVIGSVKTQPKPTAVQPYQVLPGQPGEVPHYFDPRNPGAGAKPIPGAPKVAAKPTLTPSARKALLDAAAEGPETLRKLDKLIKTEEETIALAEKYAKSFGGAGPIMGRIRGIISDSETQELQRRIEGANMREMLQEAEGKSKMFDAAKESDRYFRPKPNLNMNDEVLKNALRERLEALRDARESARRKMEAVKAQLQEETGSTALPVSRKPVEEMTVEELEAELRGQ